MENRPPAMVGDLNIRFLWKIRDLNFLPNRIDSPGSGFSVTFRNAVPIELQTPVEAADVREVGLENV